MPTELDRLGIRVGAGIVAGAVYLYLPEEWEGVAGLTPAAALELAERLKTTALRLDTGCLAYTQGGTRCSLEKGHAGHHVTGTGGWFKHAGAPEQACR
jgi:hypothetical protein